jgi:hypothetical protein
MSCNLYIKAVADALSDIQHVLYICPQIHGGTRGKSVLVEKDQIMTLTVTVDFHQHHQWPDTI